MDYNGFINILNIPIGVGKKESRDVNSVSVHGGKLGRGLPLCSLPACLNSLLTPRSPMVSQAHCLWSPSLPPHPWPSPHSLSLLPPCLPLSAKVSSPSLTPCL